MSHPCCKPMRQISAHCKSVPATPCNMDATWTGKLRVPFFTPPAPEKPCGSHRCGVPWSSVSQAKTKTSGKNIPTAFSNFITARRSILPPVKGRNVTILSHFHNGYETVMLSRCTSTRAREGVGPESAPRSMCMGAATNWVKGYKGPAGRKQSAYTLPKLSAGFRNKFSGNPRANRRP
jgi:hypothetical protein